MMITLLTTHSKNCQMTAKDANNGQFESLFLIKPTKKSLFLSKHTNQSVLFKVSEALFTGKQRESERQREKLMPGKKRDLA